MTLTLGVNGPLKRGMTSWKWQSTTKPMFRKLPANHQLACEEQQQQTTPLRHICPVRAESSYPHWMERMPTTPPKADKLVPYQAPKEYSNLDKELDALSVFDTLAMLRNSAPSLQTSPPGPHTPANYSPTTATILSFDLSFD